ncbi:MAG: transcriptional regulator [Flavobacteriia bacterium]|nr:transcriptional regulator [Flavobacteriia bacterium]
MEENEISVNYIKHLTGVFEKFSDDKRLSAYHISLYVALFQLWNINRFSNPLLIIRSEVMQISKISSKSTYHRCIRELESFGYIEYQPSKNAMIGSKINILSFSRLKPNRKGSPLNRQASPTAGHQNGQPSPISGLLDSQPSPKYGHPNEPLYKHINNTKHINLCIEQNEFCKPQKNEKVKNEILPSAVSKVVKFKAPTIELVQEYFKEKNKPDIEAQKFFNYFESNGWKIGGRSPMKNWKAAANNWMLNSSKFNPIQNQPKPDNLHTNQDKDYSIPL